MKIGDYVEVDIGHGLCISAYAQIITEHQNMVGPIRYTVKFKKSGNDPEPTSSYYPSKETHQALKEHLRVLTEKEVFELRLKGTI